MAEKTNLSILIVGPDAEIIAHQPTVKELEALGDTITVSTFQADIVIGTNCIRTYPSTTNFLKTLLKKIRNEKKSLQAPDVVKVPKKKKATKKKVVETAPIVQALAKESLNAQTEELLKSINSDLDCKEHTEEDMVWAQQSTSTVANNEKL